MDYPSESLISLIINQNKSLPKKWHPQATTRSEKFGNKMVLKYLFQQLISGYQKLN